MCVKIVLADDDDSLRRWQRRALEPEPDFEIVAEACNGREAVQRVEQSQPDVVIMAIPSHSTRSVFWMSGLVANGLSNS